MAKDYYRILQVHPNAEPEVIKAAYKRLIQKYHPDKNLKNTEEAKRHTQEINEAWDVLSNPEHRAQYDRDHFAGNDDAEAQRKKAETESKRAQDAEAARRNAEAKEKQAKEEADRFRRKAESEAQKAKGAEEARWKAEAREKQAKDEANRYRRKAETQMAREDSGSTLERRSSGKQTDWLSASLSFALIILVLSNAWLYQGNVDRQAEISNRQAIIQQAAQLEELNRSIVQTLANFTVGSKGDKQIEQMLSTLGIKVNVEAADSQTQYPSAAK